jgi:hypothetical protein
MHIERSKKSELLIGVFIGIYGNWLIAVVEKLGKSIGYSMMPFLLSFVFFLWYFQEIFKHERTFYKGWIRKSHILGSIYILLVAVSLFLNGVLDADIFFSGVGFLLWIALMQVEMLSGAE